MTGPQLAELAAEVVALRKANEDLKTSLRRESQLRIDAQLRVGTLEARIAIGTSMVVAMAGTAHAIAARSSDPEPLINACTSITDALQGRGENP
jgi:hypothetical protein